jgi:hypothetical protein
VLVADVDLAAEGGSSGTRLLRLGLLKDGLGCCGRLAAAAAATVAAADWAGWAATAGPPGIPTGVPGIITGPAGFEPTTVGMIGPPECNLPLQSSVTCKTVGGCIGGGGGGGDGVGGSFDT